MRKHPDYGRQPAFRPDATIKRKRKLRRPGGRRKLWSNPEKPKQRKCECTMIYTCALHR